MKLDLDTENNRARVIILRLRKCRRSDLIINFLQEEKIPFHIYYLNEDEEAQRIARKHNILASPGIIINGHSINPHQLIAKCQIRDRKKAKEDLENLLTEKGIKDD